MTSFVKSVEEALECIIVTSKPMWLRGHLQMLSVVDCGVYDSESKIDEVLLWKVFYDLHGFFSIYVYDCC